MSKKLLAILGSPRAGGNAEKMLLLAIRAAEKAGWEVELIRLYEKNITWCKGCMHCKKNGACVIQDDLVSLRESLLACDVVAVSAPTYFANVPAIVKNVFDRLVGTVMDDNKSYVPKPRLSGRQKYLLMTTCSTPAPFSYIFGQSRGTLKAMKEFFHISGMKKMGTVVFAGTRNKTELPKSVQNKIRRLW